MSRSSRKGPYVDQKLLAKTVRMMETGEKRIVRTWARASDIPPEFVGFTFAVHNGKDFVPVYVTEQMVGHKLGEFSFTCKFRIHGGKMAKAQEDALKVVPGAPAAVASAPAGAAAPAKTPPAK